MLLVWLQNCFSGTSMNERCSLPPSKTVASLCATCTTPNDREQLSLSPDASTSHDCLLLLLLHLCKPIGLHHIGLPPFLTHPPPIYFLNLLFLPLTLLRSPSPLLLLLLLSISVPLSHAILFLFSHLASLTLSAKRHHCHCHRRRHLALSHQSIMKIACYLEWIMGVCRGLR